MPRPGSVGGGIDPSDVRTVEQLVAKLKLLRLWAGRSTLQDMESSALGLSRSTLSEVLSGRRVPTLRFVQAFVRRCGAEDQIAAWEDAWARARDQTAEPHDPRGTWHFPDQGPITIVCPRLPERLRRHMPYADPRNPDYVRSYTFADLDALVELYGHLRAVNPSCQVTFHVADALVEDDLSDHLVLLGGVDWNTVLRDTLPRLAIPVRQKGRAEEAEYEAFFEVGEDENRREFTPTLEPQEPWPKLVEDVAHFYRARNPYNFTRTVTICNGMFGRGTYGAVRALTDVKFRARNEEYLRQRFAGQESFSILSRVLIVNGEALTPDWSDPSKRLHEWPERT